MNPPESISIGYVNRSFPTMTQATVVNELKTLQRLEYPVRMFPLLRPDGNEYHHDPGWLLPPVIYCWETRVSRGSLIKAKKSPLSWTPT